ncbi:hypothetical protein L873DRAFT_1827374 [Choiromyces venosus 120613-1]|uniref:LIM-domain binding protein n=1 Tax=Choiromyces venosus 120613-1 TaxID=1336337 RepID=A0A3N4JRQ5_9PEZI|nr:hypothetical protein L873DRAFT_1827374 [Choiromyces venosus 120613-1]
MMATTYSQHPNQLQQHPGVQQGPQQHIQGHPGQPAHAAMQHLHPQQAQAQAAQAAAFQQQQQQLVLAGMHPQMAHLQQQLVRRQQQQQQQAHLMNGMGAPGNMVFQNPNNGNPQIRTGMPNGMYQGGPGGIPGANMGGYGAGNPHMRGNVNLPPHVQQQLHAHQQQQQQQMAAAAQHMALANQANAAAANAQTPMAMPPQPPMPMQAAQQAAALAAAQARQAPKTLLGHSVLGLYRFSGHLSAFNASRDPNDINYWRKFVQEFYSQSGVMRQLLWHNNTRETKQFEVTTQVLARYYFTLFESGVQNIQIVLENVREKELANQCHIVECPKTSFIYWFENGFHLVARGALRATFNSSSKMEELDFQVDEHSEYVPRNFGENSPNIIKSSPGSKSLGKRPSQQGHASENIVNHYGVPDAVFRCLEISETISQMRDLFSFSQSNPTLAPRQALQTFVSQQQQHAQQQQQQHAQHLANQHAQQQHQQQQAHAAVMAATQGLQAPQGHPGGPGMPQHPGHQGMPGGVPVGMNSPSADGMRMGVPPSPHMGGGGGPGTTPSPAHNHIQAPGLVQQHSQQAHPTSNPSSQTSTTVVSANTSPNTNKRRRASTTSNVKNEGDDENGVNGAQNNKIKQSPRVGGNKRVKGNNAT